MVNPKIKDYIKNNINKYPINVIRLNLLKLNFSISEVNEALADVEGIELKEKFINKKQKKRLFHYQYF